MRAAFGKAVITLRYRCYTGVYRRASPKSSGEREQVSFVLWCPHPRSCLSGCKAGVDRSDGSRLRESSVMAAQLLKNSIERCACNIVCSVFKVQRREKVSLHLSPILLHFRTLFLSFWKNFLDFFHCSVDALGNILMADPFFLSNLIHGHSISKIHPNSAKLLFRKSSSYL